MDGVTTGAVIKTILTAAATAAVTNAMAPKPPTLEKPAVMPTPDTAAVEEARRRAALAQSQRGGRMSTLLSPANTDKLGG